ncbi:MAG: mannonate dehydratase, partial [Phycisphaerales bacterium]|nr:mannonate dehydratase [Phycisphaerales bacterium]
MTNSASSPVTMCMRWFGPEDPVPLAHIRQIPGITGIVSSVSGVPAGTPWTVDQVTSLRNEIAASGLTLDVIESIPVSDEIKLAGDGADAHIDAWCESVLAVADAGVKTVCYNFMPIADWVRTDLAMPLPDGSTTLAYDDAAMPAFESKILSGGARHLPAWENIDTGSFESLRERYQARGETGLWDALAAFLERVVPAAASCGIRLGIHPDDPCWSVLGLPRIVTSCDAMRRVCALVDSPANGITFCTGSLGCDPANDLVAGARELASRIAFMHARNVRTTGRRAVHESAHPRGCGDVDLPAVLGALVGGGFTGPMRPDHGRMIWGETGNAGYGLFDRALGATYLLGALD